MEAERETAGGAAEPTRKLRRESFEIAFMGTPLRFFGRALDGGAHAVEMPQRQMLVISASISASVGVLFCATKAAAAMIMPAWQ